MTVRADERFEFEGEDDFDYDELTPEEVLEKIVYLKLQYELDEVDLKIMEILEDILELL